MEVWSGLINTRRPFLKTDSEGELWRSGFNLFHSLAQIISVQGKIPEQVAP